MKTFKQFLTEQPGLNNKDTGVGTDIYISKKPDENHKYIRIKFKDPDTKEYIPIGVNDTDDVVLNKSSSNNKEKLKNLIKKVRNWILLNYEILEKFWNDVEYKIDQFRKDMKKLK